MTRRILVDRRVGGFGDLMMIGAALRKIIAEDYEVDLVLEDRWHCLFSRWDGLSLCAKPKTDVCYVYAYQLCNPCPAAMYEARMVGLNKTDMGKTHVPRSRFEMFLSALAVYLQPHEMVPAVILSENDVADARELAGNISKKTLIYVQANSAEKYRNWPRIEELINRLRKPGRRIAVHGMQLPGTIHMDGIPLLTSLALMKMSQLVITPDSMAVHASAALEIPCLSIYGPIDPSRRIATYPYASAITTSLPCVPCWRCQTDDCRMTGGPKSRCLEDLPCDAVVSAACERLSEIEAGVKTPSVKYLCI